MSERPIARAALLPRWFRLAVNHVRYATMNLFIIAGIFTMAMGGAWMWLGLLMTFVLLGMVEELIGDDGNGDARPSALYLNGMLWLTLPLLIVLAMAAINVSLEDGIGWIDAGVRFFGFDPDAARAATGFYSIGGGFASVGMYFGVAGINVAHELIHRADAPHHNIVGRWLLALSWDTQFAIAHVHEHHRYVGTDKDPSTARRGEYIFAFVVRSAIGQIRFAEQFERNRNAKKPFPQRLLQNRFWRGQAMTALVAAGFYALAGPLGLLWCVYAGVVGIIYLEVTNFIEHYGLVRAVGTRVEPRHSWDSHRWLSTGMLYNLPFHSHHHRFATRPFWQLEPAEGEAPVLPGGYMPMIVCAIFPPLWKRVSTPLLAQWDRDFASDEEREILRQRGQLLG